VKSLPILRASEPKATRPVGLAALEETTADRRRFLPGGLTTILGGAVDWQREPQISATSITPSRYDGTRNWIKPRTRLILRMARRILLDFPKGQNIIRITRLMVNWTLVLGNFPSMINGRVCPYR